MLVSILIVLLILVVIHFGGYSSKGFCNWKMFLN